MKHHPNVIEGMGLEDLETLERIFSASNFLAAIIRYMSAYSRRVAIDLFFKQWDLDKRQNWGNMLYNNYRQALDIIRTNSLVVSEAQVSLNIQDGDLEKWTEEQTEYFETIGKESDGDLHAIAYVELLQELRDIEYVCLQRWC
jgi:hypothetical protein